MIRTLTALGLTLAVSACSWVKLDPEAESVDLMNQAQAENCERIGQTTSTVVDDVLFLDRNREKMEEELLTLARNQAADMGGDAVVPATQVTDGRQRFIVYRCR